MPTVSYRYDNLQNNFVINGWTTEDQITPDVVAIDNGGFAVVYGTDDTTIFGGFDYPLYSFVDDDYNIDATLPFGDYGIPYDEFDDGQDSPDLQGAPKITRMTDGNLALVWDEGSGDDGDDDLVGAIINGETGAIITPEFVVGSAGGYQDPDLAALAGGGFVAVWESASNLRFQTFDQTGTGAGINFISTTNDSSDFHVAGLTDGGFVITWTDLISGNLASVAQIYNADGTSRTGEITVGPASATNQNSQTAVAAMPNGNWAIVYTDSGWSGDGLSLHIYDSSGAEVVGPIRIDTDVAAIESDPDVTILANGYIFVTWTYPNTNNDIYGALFDSSGTRIQLNGNDVQAIANDNSAEEILSSVATLDGGQVITSWQDSGTDDGDGGSVQGEVGALIRTTTGDATDENLAGDAMIDEIFAGNGNDTLSGGDGDDTLAGGGGNDSIFGQGDDDALFGGSGNDTISGGDGDDTMTGVDGLDQLFGGDGDDSMLGGLDADTLTGNDGEDRVFGNAGADNLLGGTGDDFVDGGDGADMVTGQNGFDELFGGLGNDTMNGGNGNDTLAGGGGADSISGNSGADELFGGGDGDFMDGGDGLDTLAGAAGNDSLFGGSANDQLFGGSGNDVIAAGIGADTLDGGSEDDQLFSGGGNDLVIGGNGNDTLDGNTGSDTLRGGDGDDRIFTGSGDDVIDFNLGDDADTVADFDAGAGSLDRIDVSSFGAAFDTLGEIIAASTDLGSDMIIEFGGGDSITLLNVNIADLHPDDFIFI